VTHSRKCNTHKFLFASLNAHVRSLPKTNNITVTLVPAAGFLVSAAITLVPVAVTLVPAAVTLVH